MSAAGVEVPAAPAPASNGISDGYVAPDLGSKSDIHDLVFEGIDSSDIPADDSVALAEEPAKDKAEANTADKDEAKTEVDEDAENIKAINRRSAERRRAKQLAQRANATARVEAPIAAKPAEAKPAEAAPAPKPAEAAKVSAAEGVQRVVDLIAQLAGGDEAAADAPTGEKKPDPARDALVTEIRAKLDAITEGTGKENAALKGQVEKLQAHLEGIEGARQVRDHVVKNFVPIEDQFPALADPKNIRAYNKEHGTVHRDAIDLIHEALGRTFDKFKFIPSVKHVAQAIEKKLAGKSPENTEKPKPSRTLSQSLGSPPAARTDPDNRTNEEAVSDFNKRFNLED